MATKIHIRRCHICGETSEVENGLVVCCDGCGKLLAPFYYFDESRAMGLKSEEDYQPNLNRRPSPLRSTLQFGV